MTFLAELQRRNVIRMAGLYLLGAWLVTQVASTVFPAFGLPAWALRGVILLLAFGFVPALVFSWVFELTPQGIKRDDEVAASESIAPQTARRMDRMILVVMALALGYFAFDKFVRVPGRMADSSAAATTSSPANTAPATAPATVNPKSIAVLAFANMSADKGNEYLSDGISEEILNALTQVRDLKVAGRTASFYFKNRSENFETIGRTLGVANVLEGSVRRQGDRVRITAQLIQVRDGFHLWSETYDGELSDVFALQERIARAISDALKVALSDTQQTRLVDAGTKDAQAYASYLEATAAYRRRDSELYPDAIVQLDKALALDPQFARAAALISLMQVALAGSKAINDPAALQARARAEQALALDPRLAEPHVTLGQIATRQWRLLDARTEFDRALALAPGDADATFYKARHLLHTGYLNAGIAALDRTLLLDPAHPNALWRRALAYIHADDVEAASLAMQRARDQGLAWVESAALELARARQDWSAARQLSAARFPTYDDTCLLPPEAAARTIDTGIYGGTPAEVAAALAVIEQCLASRPVLLTSIVPTALLRLGQPVRALQAMAAAPSHNQAEILNFLWSPGGRDARRLPQFAAFARELGFAELWDRFGPPDLCKKNDQGDYVCE